MIERSIKNLVLRYSHQYPVVIITGPRQSGKSTLCKMLFPDKTYVNLEDLEQRNYALKDPKGFLKNFQNGAVIDEIQRAPELFSYIQVAVDENNKDGLFILTGSQQFELFENISQSLAGRAAIVRLLTFSYDEIYKKSPPQNVETLLYTGFYPRIFDKKLIPTEAMSFYVNTYVERDVRKLINIKDLSVFETFVRLLAGRSGQLLNTNALANDCGLSHNTVKSWISALEASYIVKLVQPYSKNINKRLVKTPKLYFLDTGLLSYLLNIHEPSQIYSHPLKGAIFETYVYGEILKTHYNQGKPIAIYFFRDHQGNEVDLLIEKALSVDLFEIKSAGTFHEDFLKGIKYFHKIDKTKTKNYVIYGGDIPYQSFSDTSIYNWKNIAKIFQKP